MAFILCIGIFFSSWLGTLLLGIGEWMIKRLPLVKHIYSASKQVSRAWQHDWFRTQRRNGQAWLRDWLWLRDWPGASKQVGRAWLHCLRPCSARPCLQTGLVS